MHHYHSVFWLAGFGIGSAYEMPGVNSICMSLFHKIRKAWRAIRWKILIIFVFFSVVSTLLISAFSIAVLNVVIRRESAYLIEERLSAIVENQRFNAHLSGPVEECSTPSTTLPVSNGYSDLVWPGSRTALLLLSGGRVRDYRPGWLKGSYFNGMIADRGSLAIRSFRELKNGSCTTIVVATTALDSALVVRIAEAAGLQVSDSRPIQLLPYRVSEGMLGEIRANFIPGGSRAVPVVVTARSWQTGQLEDWVICRVKLSYTRTAGDLSRMGLRPASWLAPLGGLALALLCIYAGGLLLSVRLSKQIVHAIEGLSHAAHSIGKGDFSVRVSTSGNDQLGRLASAFNDMTRDLESLRQQEKQSAFLEWDVALAREIQQHLFPKTAESLVGFNIWGVNVPARTVSGDLYDFFPFSEHEVRFLCTDVSGKGVSAALMMAHLQALAHGRLLLLDPGNSRP